MEEAEQLCNEIAIVDQGRIIARGQPQALVHEHFPAAIVRLPADAWPDTEPLPDYAERRDTVIELYADAVPPVLEYLERIGAGLTALRIDTPSLEDLFLKLTGHSLRA
jgi:ABC-2 type transport system ATP-binding protein